MQRKHFTPHFREELRRYTSAIERSKAAYYDETPTTRVDSVRVCLVRDCGTTTRSQLQLCKEHR